METKKRQIMFKIKKIEKISYFENNPEQFGLRSKTIKDSKVDYGAKVDIKRDEELIEIITFAKFYLKEGNKHFDLFGIETRHSFKIKNFKDVIHSPQKDIYNIPDEIMRIFINISISGMRGMIAVLNTKPEYNRLYFPIVNSVNLLEEIKQKQNNLSPKTGKN